MGFLFCFYFAAAMRKGDKIGGKKALTTIKFVLVFFAVTVAFALFEKKK